MGCTCALAALTTNERAVLVVGPAGVTGIAISHRSSPADMDSYTQMLMDLSDGHRRAPILVTARVTEAERTLSGKIEPHSDDPVIDLFGQMSRPIHARPWTLDDAIALLEQDAAGDLATFGDVPLFGGGARPSSYVEGQLVLPD